MTNARNNRKTQIAFYAEDGSSKHSDTVHGSGFGAYVKMVDRSILALTGWTPLQTRVEFDGENATFTNRQSGESQRFAIREF